MSSMIRVTLTSGLVGKKETQKKVVHALGLRKFGSWVVHYDSPTIRGMVDKVDHLVAVEPENGDGGGAGSSSEPKKAKVKSEAKPKSESKSVVGSHAQAKKAAAKTAKAEA